MPKTAKPASKRAPNPAFMKEMTLSPELAAVIGANPMPRTEVTKKIWDYIKANNLQDAANKRMINADVKLYIASQIIAHGRFSIQRQNPHHLSLCAINYVVVYKGSFRQRSGVHVRDDQNHQPASQVR